MPASPVRVGGTEILRAGPANFPLARAAGCLRALSDSCPLICTPLRETLECSCIVVCFPRGADRDGPPWEACGWGL